ncbi:uncharacterized protein [Periplaneta americana]|uniref:uncharacterized protein n=1 Tax=Periplaneta americana TaxID=6978 RepID=UPI0037E9BB86
MLFCSLMVPAYFLLCAMKSGRFEVFWNSMWECHVPDWDTWQPRHPPVAARCSVKSRPPLVGAAHRTLFVDDSALHHYGVRNASAQLDCCFAPFRYPSEAPPSSNDVYRVASKCRQFRGSVTVTDEFVLALCYISNEAGRLVDVYEGVHAFLRLNRSLTRATHDLTISQVLILALGAPSRPELHRFMPETLAALSNLSAVEMMGFSKVGSGLHDNLLSLLTERSASACQRLDDCPFIWRNLSAAGFATAFADDTRSLLGSREDGFRRPPTDFFPLPYLALGGLKGGFGCNVPLARLERGLRYVSDLLDFLHDSKYFAVFSLLSGEDITDRHLAAIDQQLASFLRNSRLQDTVLMLLGGCAPGARLPSLQIVLPSWFAYHRTEAMRALQSNSRRLTTPFDVFETLLDLLHLSHDSAASRGRSLLEPLPRYRSCGDAGVSSQWCPCVWL